jgi:N-acetylmuramate 1-kinase
VLPVAAGAEAAACAFCDGQGGSSARAAGMMPPNEAMTIHNGLERSMKGGIIMVRRSHAGRKNPNSRMLDTDARLALIHDWLSRELHLPQVRIEVASSDASFRRYFRVFGGASTYIVMDAPPEKEDVRPYLKVSHLLEELGAHVPHVHQADVRRGLLLLEDLGTTAYLQRLERGGDSERLYADALDALANIQLRGGAACTQLSPYDRSELAREMGLMPEWFLGRHLSLTLSAAEMELLARAFEFLILEALAQPQVFVHRDYHARNLMVVSERNPGIIDFQDALCGPIGYDLVSLLKDCYVAWPRARVEGWVEGFRTRLLERGGPAGTSSGEFLRWFDLIGVQRHIKVLGIFCRLWYRDGKPGYLADLPRTLDYVREASARYRELAALAHFLEERVSPELPRANARVAAERAGAEAAP